MNLKQTYSIIILLFSTIMSSAQIVVGAENYDQYKYLIKDKNVGLVVNHTSFVKQEHLLDFLIKNGNTVSKIFAPEHGFRGTANAGEYITNSIDSKTGISIISLYGKNKKPSKEQLSKIDIILFDIQDVGVRFYTYISTMHYVMEACAENNIPMVILDRPNPNGHYIDGPILDLKYQSFIGMHPIPIVHGLTIGELAAMINNEGWLNKKCNLKIIKCNNYDHNVTYNLPIPPSPNLPNMKSIYLYPSLCLFEGTDISIGRGTNKQFQVIGHPSIRNPKLNFSFIPESNEGSKYPKHENEKCIGIDLSQISEHELREKRFSLEYIINFYEDYSLKDEFFLSNNFFNKLSGNSELQIQIESEKSETDIKKTWNSELTKYKTMRKKYLLYPDFE